MSYKTHISVSVMMVALAAAGLLAWWLIREPPQELVQRVPGLDGRARIEAEQAMRPVEPVRIGEYFESIPRPVPPPPFEPGQVDKSWPQFRGPDRDNVCKAVSTLPRSWPENGPRVRWSIELGEGHAGPAVRGGRVYILDYDESRKADSLRCFSFADGSEIWRRSYIVRSKRNHGYSRTVPAVNDRFVVTIGPHCHVMCVDAASGDLAWTMDLVREFGAEVPLWYAGQCPMIEGDTAVLAVGGTNTLMMGVNCTTGDVLWQTPNPGRWKMSHSSIMRGTVAGRDTYVYCALGGVVGVSAEKEDRGTILWKTGAWRHSVVVPSPVIIDQNTIFLTAGYGAGSMVIRVTREGAEFDVKVTHRLTPKDGIGSEQQTPVLYNGGLFAVLPKNAGALRSQLVCADPADPTRLLWSSGKTKRFGLGPVLVVGDKLLVLDDDGTLTMAEADTDRYVELARAKVLDGPDAWGPMAFVDGALLLRDIRRMVCLQLDGL